MPFLFENHNGAKKKIWEMSNKQQIMAADNTDICSM
jgi:hypothetical protein